MNTRISLCITVVSLTLAAGACDRGAPSASAGGSPAPADSASKGTEADKTARSKAEGDTKTPLDQSNSAEHIKVTADIRRVIMEDTSMSVSAQNCKIITDKAGIVTLRGPVESQAEKDAIESKAKAVAGVNGVVNELEVKRT